MPIQIRERPPKRFNVVKPRRQPTTETQAMKQTAGSIQKETLQSLAKRSRQEGGSYKAPSSNRENNSVDGNMNKNYEDHFFKMPRGHNRGSVNAMKQIRMTLNTADFFR